MLRELRHEQEVLREQLESHAAAMERVQAEADAAKRERDVARAELRRVQANWGVGGQVRACTVFLCTSLCLLCLSLTQTTIMINFCILIEHRTVSPPLIP